MSKDREKRTTSRNLDQRSAPAAGDRLSAESVTFLDFLVERAIEILLRSPPKNDNRSA